MAWQVHCGESADVLKLYPDCCFDSMVTDPPAGIRFMGKAWDGDHGGRDKWIAWLAGILREAHRVLKPGAHALVWALPRTQHWTQTACEDAGFEVRDVLAHMFGSGFPKSLDVSKAIDSAAGAERDVIGAKPYTDNRGMAHGFSTGGVYERIQCSITTPATDAAKQWDGWGTALKPAHESWILCRKPMGQTVAANVLEFGTGAINVDGCRVGTDERFNPPTHKAATTSMGSFANCDGEGSSVTGRWPPNLLLSHAHDCEPGQCGESCVVAELGRQSGETSTSGGVFIRRGGTSLNASQDGSLSKPIQPTGPRDTGTAARFFPTFNPDPPDFPFLYVAKPSSAEKDAGLDTFQALTRAESTDRGEGSAGSKHARAGAGAAGRRNGHPTTKGAELMRWLCRLITPPGGVVLDPFAGSGTTGIACMLEGFSFHGIELDPYHTDIARARIAHVSGGTWEPMTEQAQAVDPKQGSLFK